ncbi:MAG TPA: prevent-host-death protein [Deltaproteobacteria bacterium]|nr:MAG: hypothetical protein A2048_05045 [Deltaproteobacteria bacterium GWA2_45_12]HBF12853.1 prevent-host-death protein [Deltaproteobacteria bacterium]
MTLSISKAALKPKLLSYLRFIEEKKEKIIITDHGRPVATILPYSSKKDGENIQKQLKNSILKYENPLDPVGLEDWKLIS